MAEPHTTNPPDPIIGIDLGTTNSVVAICDDRGPRALTDPSGGASGASSPILPSVVRYSDDGARVEAVGDSARALAVQHPQRTITSVKRLMGRSLSDAAADLPYLAYQVAEGAHDTARAKIADRLISPQEVSAEILRALKQRAERDLGRPVRRAVITAPAYFDDAQRQATRDAGRLAGLDVVRIVNEPTAAALAYGLGERAATEQTIAVYDLGGGTFDVSILRLTPGEHDPAKSAPSGGGAEFFEVLSTAGDTHLGGDDVDQMIVAEVLRGIAHETRSPTAAASLAPETRQALRLFAEAVKIRLSSEDRAALRIDLGPSNDGSPRVYERVFTRNDFEAMIRPWVEHTLECCRRALRDAKLKPADVERVVMVGGSTRIPLVRRMVGEFFGADPYTALDPDLVVALGAAVQGAIVSGADRSRLLLDVIPLSLGIETAGGAVAKLIIRNQKTPARATEMFTTSVDGQTSIKINILQGEREMAADCRSLGEFHLRGLPPMPAGVPQLQVEFLVDANGVLNVAAVERRSGKRAALQVVPRHGLSRDEVDRMETESLAHARDDMQRHRVVDLVVNARLDVKWTRDTLARVASLLQPETKTEIERRIDELEALIAQADAEWRSVNADAFHRAKDSLDRSTVRMHEIAIAESLRSDQEKS